MNLIDISVLFQISQMSKIVTQLLLYSGYRLQHWRKFLCVLMPKLINHQLLLPSAAADKPQGLGYNSQN